MIQDVAMLTAAGAFVCWIGWITWRNVTRTMSHAAGQSLSFGEWMWVIIIAGLILAGALIGAGPVDLPIGKLLRGHGATE